jgi:hypothetical protein
MNSAHSFTEGADAGQPKVPVIKFSHKYIKLMDNRGEAITQATLLQVLPVEISQLSREFINYDTDNGKYVLPFKGFYIMLIFQKQNCDLFTTLRSMHSYNKWRGKEINKLPYYEGLVGKTFNVLITTEKEVAHG